MSMNNNTYKTRRKYDDQFKKDAIQRVLLTGKSCAEVGRELGVKGNLIARWQREQLSEADRNQKSTETLKPSEMAEQLRQVRKEAADLRMQRDILKKALSIFSQLPPEGEK